jgi:DNA polymerase IV
MSSASRGYQCLPYPGKTLFSAHGPSSPPALHCAQLLAILVVLSEKEFQASSWRAVTCMLTILHVDMDAFYASVEQRDRPELRGKPVIVGGSADSRGVVCAASYEARKFGVHSAMPASRAHRLCPGGVFLPPRMSYYAQISRQIREVLFSYTPLVEPLSLDEAYLDVRGCEPLFGPAPEIARQIKARISEEVGLIASVGVAPNKFLAKLASDLSKPDGLLVIEANQVADFLTPLPVSRLWGVGVKGENRLNELGIRTIGDVAATPADRLIERFGETGEWIWNLANGRDERPVVSDREAKSVSTETTFARDIGDREVLRGWLHELVEQLGQRLRHQGIRARSIELKIRSSDFRTYTRSRSLDQPTDVTAVIWKAAVELFEMRIPKTIFPVRLLGVGATRLVRNALAQGDLFENAWRAKQSALDGAVDQIRARYGTDAIRRGGLQRPAQEG